MYASIGKKKKCLLRKLKSRFLLEFSIIQSKTMSVCLFVCPWKVYNYFRGGYTTLPREIKKKDFFYELTWTQDRKVIYYFLKTFKVPQEASRGVAVRDIYCKTQLKLPRPKFEKNKYNSSLHVLLKMENYPIKPTFSKTIFYTKILKTWITQHIPIICLI